MKFVICGNYGAKNIGDELILQGLLTSIKNIDEKAQITVLSANPSETSKRYKVESAYKFPAGIRSFFRSHTKTKKAVKECDYFILGGGGLFGSLSFRANLIWATQARRALKYKKSLIMYGQSIGPLNGSLRQRLVHSIFSPAHFIAVRDQDSRERLTALGITKTIHTMPDLAFRIPEAIIKRRNATILVALRELHGLPQYFIKSVANFLNWLIEQRGYKVNIIDFQEGNGSDHRLNHELLRYIEKLGKVKKLKQSDIMEADMVLGMRFHSIISAVQSKIPFIAINYAPKVEAFIKDAGFNQHMLEIEEVSAQTLQQKFEIAEDPHYKPSFANIEKQLRATL
ncbi:polysaccharide pyruvyl transferase family protein [Candidatus Gracilibacteria bacterium]|nr:polysaccharide pyruvyl transferase family protein [Candidatus Gracilibacteria bacterium]